MVTPVSQLPLIDVHIGGHDILRPAVSDLAAQAGRAGVDLHVHEVSAMFHVWMTRLIPEGCRTRRELTALVMTRAQSAACSAGPGTAPGNP